MEELCFKVEIDFSKQRIDKYLCEKIDNQSRSFIQKLISDGQVLINNKPIKSNYKVSVDDEIVVTIPEPEELDIVAKDIPLDVYYEDEHIIVINKPKGMVVHPAPGHYENTLVNALMYHCKDDLSSINGVLRPGIVHRIDKDTTGLLLVCKSDQAHRIMSDKFKVHDIKRKYTAIVYNGFTEAEGTVNKPINRSQNDRKKMAIDPLGREAITHYTILEKLKNNFTLIECQLETGRTHQIRVHMASINHPLLGDDIYGPKDKPFKTNGQVLHAGTLGFNHPINNEYIEFEAPLPEYFTKILDRLKY